MNQEELSQVKQDIEHLISDVKKLMQTNVNSCCNGEDGQMSCHSKWAEHKRPLMCLGLAALVGGVVGAILVRKPTA